MSLSIQSGNYDAVVASVSDKNSPSIINKEKYCDTNAFKSYEKRINSGKTSNKVKKFGSGFFAFKKN